MATKKQRTEAAAEESVSDEVQQVLNQLHDLQEQLEKINENADEEMIEIEAKYKKMRDPVYARRNNIISRIPEFWFSVFKKHPVLATMLTEYEKKIFGYLESLSVEDLPDPRNGFCISFTFKRNPHFKNKTLTKTIKFSDDGKLRSVGTIIMWKPGKGPEAKINNRRTRNSRPLPRHSFLKWISDTVVDINHDIVGEIIKMEIWPEPLEHFNENVEDDEDNEADEEDNDGKGDDSDGDIPSVKDGDEAEDST